MIPATTVADDIGEQLMRDAVFCQPDHRSCSELTPGAAPMVWFDDGSPRASFVPQGSIGTDLSKLVYLSGETGGWRRDGTAQSGLVDDIQWSKPSKSLKFRTAEDPWLRSTLAQLNVQREEAQTPVQEKMLETTEWVVQHLASIAIERRPILAIDADGLPSFATSTPNFYIHLTVDGPGKLTWYAVVGGVEYFDENVGFDGRILPLALAELLAA